MRLTPRLIRKALSAVLLPLVLSIASSASGGGIAQDPEFQIRTRVDLVVVPVTVKRSGDRPVSGLTKDDFTVLEDGRGQAITNFTIDPVPLSAAILVDTGLSPASLTKVRGSFSALAGALSESDEAAVYHFDTHVQKLLDFSTDNALVETALKTMTDVQAAAGPAVASGPLATPGPMINGIPIVPAEQLGPPGARIPLTNHKVLHDAIFQAATDLDKRARDRRKVVIVISDGKSGGDEHSFDETIARLLDKEIQVYAIGMDLSFLTRRLSVLGSYAKDTGGDAFFVSSVDALEISYARATDEARNQYILGYISSNRVVGTAPVFRQIDVKLTGNGYEIRHRKGYFQAP